MESEKESCIYRHDNRYQKTKPGKSLFSGIFIYLCDRADRKRFDVSLSDPEPWFSSQDISTEVQIMTE